MLAEVSLASVNNPRPAAGSAGPAIGSVCRGLSSALSLANASLGIDGESRLLGHSQLPGLNMGQVAMPNQFQYFPYNAGFESSGGSEPCGAGSLGQFSGKDSGIFSKDQGQFSRISSQFPRDSSQFQGSYTDPQPISVPTALLSGTSSSASSGVSSAFSSNSSNSSHSSTYLARPAAATSREILGKHLSPAGSLSDSPKSGHTSPMPRTLETSPKNPNASPNAPKSPTPTADIWCEDVLIAFEEALRIVPKNGLNKIRIGGCNLGRNELIAEYILAKTGKLRSRKQVSSHIQVVKNMEKNPQLISLISNGPVFETQEEVTAHREQFERVFKDVKVKLGKRLEKNTLSSDVGKDYFQGRHSRARRQRPRPICAEETSEYTSAFRSHSAETFGMTSSYTPCDISNISFEITTDRRIALCVERPSTKYLGARESTYIWNHFGSLEALAPSSLPGLTTGSTTILPPFTIDTSSTPVVYSHVALFNPLLLSDSTDVGRTLSCSYQFNTAKWSESSLSCLTCVYSFGKKILCVNEPSFVPNVPNAFLTDFWRNFFLRLPDAPSAYSTGMKGIFVKQIIYKWSASQNGTECVRIPSESVQAVLLWEFTDAETLESAFASSCTLTFADEASEQSSYSAPILSSASSYNDAASPLNCLQNRPSLLKTSSSLLTSFVSNSEWGSSVLGSSVLLNQYNSGNYQLPSNPGKYTPSSMGTTPLHTYSPGYPMYPNDHLQTREVEDGLSGAHPGRQIFEMDYSKNGYFTSQDSWKYMTLDINNPVAPTKSAIYGGDLYDSLGNSYRNIPDDFQAAGSTEGTSDFH